MIEIEFKEPETFKIGDVIYEIIPLKAKYMPKVLEFIELTDQVDELKAEADELLATNKSPKNAKKIKPTKEVTKRVTEIRKERNKLFYENLSELCDFIIDNGLRIKGEDTKAEIPREYRTMTKLMDIATYIVKTTIDLEQEVDTNLPKKDSPKPKKKS